jgi:DNA-binding NtrC family response regulator
VSRVTVAAVRWARSARVLIVDDEENVRRMTRVLLSLKGFDIVAAVRRVLTIDG